LDRIPGTPPCASVMVSEQEIETLSPDHSGSKVAVAPLLHSANETVAETLENRFRPEASDT